MKRCAFALLLAVMVAPANAGTFRISTPWYEFPSSPGHGDILLVTVGAVANYEGAIETADRYWSIQTHLDWNYGSDHGVATTGVGIPSTRQIKCDPNSCGASGEVPWCVDDGESNSYRGGGGTTILHVHGNSEIDTKLAPWGYTYCIEPPQEEGSDPESPPGDGSGTDNHSPILIDLDHRGFRLTDLEGGVLFDLDSDGAKERVAWTAMASQDAFLALDRNSNGRIDSGAELFGDSTPQPLSADPHGFLALSVFDAVESGGNDDGWISAVDLIYEDLLLWVDTDHDGNSEPDEMGSLADSGVEAIRLHVVESRRQDRHGNLIRFKSLVRLTRATTEAIDVFLITE